MNRLMMTGLGVLAAAATAGVVACNATDDGGGSHNGSGANSGSGSGADDAGVGGFNNTGGGNSTGSGGECAAVAEEANPIVEPADIIFAIDTSGSMSDEIGFVQQNMNNFSQQIVASGVDVRVIMLAEHPFCQLNICIPGTGLCIDPPLGSGACPMDETNLPAYLHVPDSEVGSTDSLSVIVDKFSAYSGQLRQNSKKYVVIITDDNAEPFNIANAQEFINTFTAQDPASLTGFITHAIYCFDSQGDCVTKGQVYEDLVNATGGIHGNLALQDFTPIFNDMAQQVIINAGKLPCEFAIPEPPMNQTLNPNEVNVVFTDGNNNPIDIYKVDDESKCDPMNGGWYFDDNNSPTTIKLCPASCSVVSGDPDGKIDILFGCASKVDDPN